MIKSFKHWRLQALLHITLKVWMVMLGHEITHLGDAAFPICKLAFRRTCSVMKYSKISMTCVYMYIQTVSETSIFVKLFNNNRNVR